jgi:hypothetical protein
LAVAGVDGPALYQISSLLGLVATPFCREGESSFVDWGSILAPLSLVIVSLVLSPGHVDLGGFKNWKTTGLPFRKFVFSN